MTQTSASSIPDAAIELLPDSQQHEIAPYTRCAHLFGNSTRCRLPTAYPEIPFCTQHAALPEHQHVLADLTASLLEGLEDFTSAVTINEFLTRLLRLATAGKITPRRASILAYIGQLLLRSIPVMERQEVCQDAKVVYCGWPDPNLPRPESDRAAATDKST